MLLNATQHHTVVHGSLFKIRSRLTQNNWTQSDIRMLLLSIVVSVYFFFCDKNGTKLCTVRNPALYYRILTTIHCIVGLQFLVYIILLNRIKAQNTAKKYNNI